MSFICKTCGTAQANKKQSRVVTAIRKVKYLYKIKYNIIKISEELGLPVIAETRLRTVKTTQGTEIVSEDIYCRKCAPTDIILKVIAGEEVREKIVKIINTTEDRLHRRKNTFRRRNNYGRTRKGSSSIKQKDTRKHNQVRR